MNIMMLNGLLLLLLFMWTSAETKPKSERTEELQDKQYENETRFEIKARRKACRNLSGKCIKRKRECPINRPLETTPGRPYCSKRRRCCYPEPPATTLEPLATTNPTIACSQAAIAAFTEKHVCGDCLEDESGGFDALSFTIDQRPYPPDTYTANDVFSTGITDYAIDETQVGVCKTSPNVWAWNVGGYWYDNTTKIWSDFRKAGSQCYGRFVAIDGRWLNTVCH